MYLSALAARLQGLPRLMADADITPATDDENLENLAGALQELDARVFTEEVPEGLSLNVLLTICNKRKYGI